MNTVRRKPKEVSTEGEKVCKKWTTLGMKLVVFCLALAVPFSANSAVFNVPSRDVVELIDAINTANGNGEADTINLEAGTYTLTAVNNNTSGANGLPSIISSIAINGGANTTVIVRDADALPFRIFLVEDTGTLTLIGLTIAGGFAVDDGVFLSDTGGGILNAGTLTLNNSTVSSNLANSGAGGIENGGSATLINSIIEDNKAGTFGGGINSFNRDPNGTLTLNTSTVRRNFAGLDGGGVEIGGGSGTITDSTISSNQANRFGGGIANSGASGLTSITITNSTISNNEARFGGGIQNFNAARLTLNNVTITRNTATNGASRGRSGISNQAGSTVIISNTIIAQNTSDDCEGVFNSQGFNLIGNNQGCEGFGGTNGDKVGTPDNQINAMLSGLANNGGPTHTHALVVGSPAIDAVATGCPPPATDQRGVGRPQAGDCDIGAFEGGVTADADGEADLAVTAAATPDPGVRGQRLTYTLTVTNRGPTTATGVQLTDQLPAGAVLDGPGIIRPGSDTCGGIDSAAICNLGTLPSGAEAIVTIDVIPTTAGTLTNEARVTSNEPDPDGANNIRMTMTPVELPLEPLTPRATCSTVRCALRLACHQAESENCENEVTLFVPAPARRLSGELSARATRRIRFATAITNIPPGQSRNVRLKLTRKGQQTRTMLIRQGKRRLVGFLQIRNAPGDPATIDTIPNLTVRLR